ncbi:cytochrome P450 6B2-like [Cydia pomonella]|uniref:cytochrome P450 6B2-like n=1 Tax=Cydia pomonella TaxID=82600 RepID=UPI002ADD367C|nr:cytochrome P450 6B2-like [Cydia pomonella]
MLAVALVVLIASLIYIYGTRNHKYWAERGIKHDKPLPIFGNALSKFFQKISLADLYSEAYKKYPNERFVGMYLANNVMLVLRDPELIKHVLVTDFQCFHPRGLLDLLPTDDVPEPMMRNLFLADGDLWKLLRQRLTPAFTTGRLKAMFPLIIERAEKLQDIAIEAANTGVEVDIRELMARYTRDFIGACGFGIHDDSLNDENSIFRRLGRRLFTRTKRDDFVAIVKIMAPSLFKKLHFLVPEIEENTMLLVTSILEQRNYRPSGRNDFIDILLEIKQEGKIVGKSFEKDKADGTTDETELELNEVMMAAQVLVFFVAGFETSSLASSYTLHQLAFHPKAQIKCQEEIDEVLGRYGKLSYEAVKEMKYLKMCFREAMRMHPPVGFLARRCVSRYTFPGTGVTIDPGVGIIVPIDAMHNDELFFQEPYRFFPERFSPEDESQIPKHVYLPFGEGPRACIGEQLGLMQSLAGLAALLQRCSVAPGHRTVRNPVTDPASTLTQTLLEGLPLVIQRRTE